MRADTMARQFSDLAVASVGIAYTDDAYATLAPLLAAEPVDPQALRTAAWSQLNRSPARAAALRSEMAAQMSKPELARALREAREWMTMH